MPLFLGLVGRARFDGSISCNIESNFKGLHAFLELDLGVLSLVDLSFVGPHHASRPTCAHSFDINKAEYRALASATANLRWFCYLLRDLGIFLKSPSLLLCDNLSTLSVAHNPIFHARTRYIENDFHFVLELLSNEHFKHN